VNLFGREIYSDAFEIYVYEVSGTNYQQIDLRAASADKAVEK
jgi:hypothetical protein